MSTLYILANRYEVGEEIGYGGMSEVRLGLDKRLERDVAIKILRTELAKDRIFYLRFRREAQSAASLNHRNIVQVYDTGESEVDGVPLPFIVMEYIDGETLREVLNRELTVEPKLALSWIADVCEALEYSHQNNIVHRDIKPGNIMLEDSGAIKVMDFGIARAISDATSTLTQTAAVIGTARYLSPEQAKGQNVDARSDVYSVGCVLFELLTGQPPFAGDSPVAVAYQHVREDPPLPSNINPSLSPAYDSVLMKALSKNPANRYQSAEEMRQDLLRILRGLKPIAPLVMSPQDHAEISQSSQIPPISTSSPAAPVKKSKKFSWYLLTGAAVVVIGGLVGITTVFMHSWSGHHTDSATQLQVPSVVGMSQDDARIKLQNLGFNVSIDLEPSNNIPEGQVIDTSPPVNTEVIANSTISLVISSGPKLVHLPDLKGKTQKEATDTLTRLGLLFHIKKSSSSAQDKGKVLDMNPDAGNQANAKQPVELTVGSGPSSLHVPYTVGQSVDKAQQNLETLKFKVHIKEVDSAKPHGEVLSSNPAEGATALEGADITLTVSKGGQIKLPNLVGMKLNQAQGVMAKLGWHGNFVKQIHHQLDGNKNFLIEQQSIPAGTTISSADDIPIIVAGGLF